MEGSYDQSRFLLSLSGLAWGPEGGASCLPALLLRPGKCSASH